MSQINKVSELVKTAIKRKSAFGLPDRPSDQGMKPEDIKRAFWQPVVDLSYSAITEIDRVVDELNLVLSGTMDAHIARTDNPHNVTKDQVGLGKVDNTADADKPVSTAQRQAITAHNVDAEAHLSIRQSIENGLALKVAYTDIDDTFTSTDIRKPLSAYRGKLLYDSLQTTIGKADNSINGISLNSENGIMTITRTDGTSFTIDLPLEYLVKEGRYNAATQEIELELENGNVLKIPVAALVNEYYGDGTTVTGYTDTDGKLKFKISDTYKKAIDANTGARHTHDNKTVLDSISAAFTTALKTTYDGYAGKISAVETAIETEAKTREEQLALKASTEYVDKELAKKQPTGDYATNAGVDSKIASAITGIIGGAPKEFDTFKELADYVASDKTATAQMLANINKNTTGLASEVSTRESEIKRLEGLIAGGGTTIIGDDGEPMAEVSISDLSSAMSIMAEEAEKAAGYTPNGAIARKFRAIEKRLAEIGG